MTTQKNTTERMVIGSDQQCISMNVNNLPENTPIHPQCNFLPKTFSKLT